MRIQIHHLTSPTPADMKKPPLLAALTTLTTLIQNNKKAQGREAVKKLKELEAARDQITIQLNILGILDDKEMVRRAAGMEIPQNEATQIYTEMLEKKRERLALLAKGLGKNHPQLALIDQTIDQLFDDAIEEAESLKEVLQVRRDHLSRQIDKLTELIRGEIEKSTPLNIDEVKADYKHARELLQKLQTKQQDERLRLKTPSRSITIHEWSK